MTDLAIETYGLSKRFGSVQALESLNLQVPRGSIFGFLGPNGAGKSTTIKLLLGLSRATAGSGQIFGLDVRTQSVAVRRRIGYLAQEPRFYDDLSVRETLRFVAHVFTSGPSATLERRIDETIDLVGLQDKADRPIRGFSTGERQRLGIAQAQVHEPELLILDEPAASLDPMGRHDVLEIMQRLRERGTTVFYSTHILGDVQRVSDTVAILNRGRLVSQAPIDEVLQSRGGDTYTLALQGDAQPALQRLAQEPWIRNVDVLSQHGTTRLKVHVTDKQAASAQLVQLVTAGGSATVQEFGHDKPDLEDVFLKLVEEGDSSEQ
jgi:ABC-2 type transport system ATP-binding protein